jgi:hypothetical protein
MRRTVVLSMIIASLFACPPSKAADIYSCQVKEHLSLDDNGLVRATPLLTISSPQFMIDKTTGNAVGEIFSGVSTWKIVQQGSTANSLVSQGSVLNFTGRSVVVYNIIVYSFRKQNEKPFVVENRESDGNFQVFSGICK